MTYWASQNKKGGSGTTRRTNEEGSGPIPVCVGRASTVRCDAMPKRPPPAHPPTHLDDALPLQRLHERGACSVRLVPVALVSYRSIGRVTSISQSCSQAARSVRREPMPCARQDRQTDRQTRCTQRQSNTDPLSLPAAQHPSNTDPASLDSPAAQHQSNTDPLSPTNCTASIIQHRSRSSSTYQLPMLPHNNNNKTRQIQHRSPLP